MATSCKELKRIARENLTGHYKTPMGAFLMASLITLAIELPFSMLLQSEYATTFQTILYYVVDFLISLLGMVLSVGVSGIHLRLARQQEVAVPQMFGPIRTRPDRYLIAGFLKMVLTFAAVIPLGIGIAYAILAPSVKATGIAVVLGLVSLVLAAYIELKLALVFFLMLDDEALSPTRAFRLSADYMKHQMGRLLYLELSFIGMYLLGILSLGIGLLWVIPYRTQTLAQFYLDICKKVPQGDTF